MTLEILVFTLSQYLRNKYNKWLNKMKILLLSNDPLSQESTNFWAWSTVTGTNSSLENNKSRAQYWQKVIVRISHRHQNKWLKFFWVRDKDYLIRVLIFFLFCYIGGTFSVYLFPPNKTVTLYWLHFLQLVIKSVHIDHD